VTRIIEIQELALWDRLKERNAPLTFDLEITARCNNGCRHCYINRPADDRETTGRELTLSEISDLADQAVRMGAVWVLITGGEPLLRRDFEDIYLTLKRKGLLVSVFTNATLISEEHVALFKRYPPRDIEITVYGASEATYERVTQKTGSFRDFMNGLNRLMENGVRVRLKAMAMRSNFKELPEIAAFCRSRTKDYFRFDPLLHLRLDGDERRNREIRAERLTPGEIVEIERADEERFSALRKDCGRLIREPLPGDASDLLFHCGAGKGLFSISHDGQFRLCASLQAPETLFNLRRGTLREAWERHVPKVLDTRSNRKEFIDHCRSCGLIDLCLWCPANAYLESGEMDRHSDYFCEVAQARAEAIQEGMVKGQGLAPSVPSTH
jgi:radical SAM protein with 4Fe4S-binding SPASM domain